MPRRAAQKTLRPDEPNVVLPLATSINERGVLGYTHSITNSEDQRKLNCMYEAVKNPMTGKGTLALVKRPGVIPDVSASGLGSTTQNVFLIITEPGTAAVFPWIANKNGNDIRVSSLSTDTTLFSSATPSYTPAFVDSTVIYLTPGVGTQYIVVQVRNGGFSGVQRIFYSTAIATWVEISDVDFVSLNLRGKMEHMDGYAFILAADNLIWNSDLNSLANWTATSFIAKQITQDLAIGLAKFKKQILAFGARTMEVFYNNGGTTGSPLSPLGNAYARIGMVAPLASTNHSGGHYYCIVGENMYFVGRSEGGENSVSVYAYNGSSGPVRVSNNYVDKILSERISTGDFTTSAGFSSVNSVGVNGKVAAAFLLTTPNEATQRALLFFPEWKEWFEWSSTVFSTINGGAYFLPCLSGSKDDAYKFPFTDNYQDDGTSYPWFTQFKHPGRNARNFMYMYGVDADTDTVANDLIVEVSDNDCVSFSTLGTIDQTKERKVGFRGGSFYKRHVRIGNTNARPSRIHNWLARID